MKKLSHKLSRQTKACAILCVLLVWGAMTGCSSNGAESKATSTASSSTNRTEVLAVISKQESENAVVSLKSIRNAQNSFFGETSGIYATFDQLVKKQYLPVRFKGEKPVIMGYVFTIKYVAAYSQNNPTPLYSVNADPVERVGRPHFLLDYDHVIRINERQAATANDPIYEGEGK